MKHQGGRPSETPNASEGFRLSDIGVSYMQSQRCQRLAEMDRDKLQEWTQAKVAKALGVKQQTVAAWFRTNTTNGNASKPDARVKINPERKPEIAARVEAGESLENPCCNPRPGSAQWAA